MMAASHGRLLLVNVLLARGADPLLENLSGVTAIEMALESNYIDSELIALRMLSGVSDTEIGKTLIVPALYHGKMHVAKYLLHHGVRTAYSTPNVWTRVRSLSELEVPLVHWWLGTTYNSAPDTREVLKLLLSEGLEVNTKDPQSGRTPLHTATFRISDPDVLEMLLSHGACANARDHEGVTPLCGAVRANHLTQIPPLVRAGACLQGCEKLFGIAVSLRRFQVILLLLHAGYNPSSSDMKTLVELGPRVPEPIQVLISSVRSEPTPLPMLCAAVLRETLQDRLNSYLDSVGCPYVVRSFIHLEHLCKRFLDLDSWNRILQWGQ
ncbi:ankyrin-3 [Plakobranchus ocellatus]|uniref:Ankyrin-3 n=1 Tax=Plakobranchus ocellatus TaxID=259542 RepID=A0AAV3XW60_9GAST|nr:ankyrin-3 [Plakobranchus ocellatus]